MNRGSDIGDFGGRFGDEDEASFEDLKRAVLKAMELSHPKQHVRLICSVLFTLGKRLPKENAATERMMIAIFIEYLKGRFGIRRKRDSHTAPLVRSVLMAAKKRIEMYWLFGYNLGDFKPVKLRGKKIEDN